MEENGVDRNLVKEKSANFGAPRHQGGRKPWLIKRTLFGLYLIRYQPYLSILESF
jgi:hypothetical protein